MNLSSHLDQLRTKHQTLKTRIKEEERRPGVDHLEIAAMKREKLHVKEEIARLSQDVH
ncbi:MAG: YdcH family protein [Pseudomonadota bacterium]